MRFTQLWIVVGIAAIAYSLMRVFTQQPTEWTLPVLVGGVACLLAGLYQAWWERSVLEEEDERSGRRAVWLRVTKGSKRSP